MIKQLTDALVEKNYLFTTECPFICAVGVFDSKAVEASSVFVIIILSAEIKGCQKVGTSLNFGDDSSCTFQPASRIFVLTFSKIVNSFSSGLYFTETPVNYSAFHEAINVFVFNVNLALTRQQPWHFYRVVKKFILTCCWYARLLYLSLEIVQSTKFTFRNV